MSAPRSLAALALLVLCLLPGRAGAQSAAAAAPTEGRRPWVVAGGASTTLLGDCTNCEADTYLHSGGVLVQGGVTLNPRTDFGAEFFWVPETLSTGESIRVTFLNAVVQYRPWRSRGFFLKGGAGMAFLRNWLDAFDNQSPPVRSKAFSLVLATGWEWKVNDRFGVQAFGSQHAAALGDLQTSEQTIENVMGNLWSVGGAVVFR